MPKRAEGSGVKSLAAKVWRILRWPLLLLVIAYIALVVWRIIDLQLQSISDKAVAEIRSQRLTISDVNGEHLPPPPDPAQVNATIAGVDANDNGIRDDVELAIFAKYPGKANEKLRAAELQYAMELQIELDGKITDSGTWKANAQAESRGYGCISETYPREPNLEMFVQVTDKRVKEVEDLVFNNKARELERSRVASYETSYGFANSNLCDVSY